MLQLQNAEVRDYGKGLLGCYELFLELNAEGESDIIQLPNRVQSVAIQLKAEDGAEVKFQYTMYPISKISEAVWSDGNELTATTFTDVVFPVSAIKLIQVGAGKTQIAIRAQ